MGFSDDIILGLSMGADAAAAIVKNGRLLGLVEEETLSRRPGHAGFPYRAIPVLLRTCGVKPEEVGATAIASRDQMDMPAASFRKILAADGGHGKKNLASRLLEATGKALSVRFNEKSGNPDENKAAVLNILSEYGILSSWILVFPRQFCHSAAACAAAPFDEAVTFTCGARGDDGFASVHSMRERSLEKLAEAGGSVSPWMFLETVNSLLKRGLREEDRGEMTAGAENLRAQMLAFLFYDGKAKAFQSSLAGDESEWRGRLGKLLEGLDESSALDAANAAWKILEDSVSDFVGDNLPDGNVKPVVLGGEMFSFGPIVRAVGKLEKVPALFVSPHASGGALAHGAAACASGLLLGGELFPGQEFSDGDMEKCLARHDLKYEYCEDIESRIARDVASDRLVARFSGRMECGKRSLGNRGVLFSGSEASLGRLLGDKFIRPSQPEISIMAREETAGSLFLGHGKFKHAAKSGAAPLPLSETGRAEIPAAALRGGDAHAQTVAADENPKLHKILSEYEVLTGAKTMLNTGFRAGPGKPLVGTPEDAAALFAGGAADVLAIGNYRAERTASAWNDPGRAPCAPPLKVCHASFTHLALDSRIFYKEAISLRDMGHEVEILNNIGFSSFDFAVRRFEGIKVSNFVINVPFAINVLEKFTFIKPLSLLYWKLRWLGKLCRAGADVYHLHDYSLVGIALVLKALFGKKVVYDVHEWYPEFCTRNIRSRLKRRLEEAVVRFADRLQSRRADAVIATEPAKKARYEGYGVRTEKLFHIANYPRRESFEGVPPPQLPPKGGRWGGWMEMEKRGLVESRLARAKNLLSDAGTLSVEKAEELARNVRECARDLEALDKNPVLTLVYTGGLTFFRGIDKMVGAAIAAAKENDIHIRIILAGAFYDSAEGHEIKALCGRNARHVSCWITGWMDNDKVAELLKGPHIGLAPLQPLPIFELAVSNKIFEYMAAGIPTICCDLPLFKEAIAGHDAGICTDCTREENIKDAINFYIRNPRAIVDHGGNGRRAFLEKYNWGVEEKKLRSAYAGLFK